MSCCGYQEPHAWRWIGYVFAGAIIGWHYAHEFEVEDLQDHSILLGHQVLAQGIIDDRSMIINGEKKSRSRWGAPMAWMAIRDDNNNIVLVFNWAKYATTKEEPSWQWIQGHSCPLLGQGWVLINTNTQSLDEAISRHQRNIDDEAASDWAVPG